MVHGQRGTRETQAACLRQPIIMSMAATLRDSVAVVAVRTHPRAMRLARMNIRKSTYGSPFHSYMSMGLRLAGLRAAWAPLKEIIIEIIVLGLCCLDQSQLIVIWYAPLWVPTVLTSQLTRRILKFRAHLSYNERDATPFALCLALQFVEHIFAGKYSVLLIFGVTKVITISTTSSRRSCFHKSLGPRFAAFV